jgi:hypothetical protein
MKTHFLSLLLFCCGASLGAQELAPAFGSFISVTPNNLYGSTRPRIALVNDSIPVVIWGRNNTATGHLYVSRWNGSAFTTPVAVSQGLDVYTSSNEGSDLAAQGDTAYIVFFTSASQCYCIHSYDGALTWSDTVRIDHAPLRHAYTPNVEIDRNGNPVVVFESSDPTMMMNPAQMVCRSYDGGNSFTMEQPAHTNVTGVPCECCPPDLLISDSMTYVIYRNNENNRRDIVMTISSDSGITFPAVAPVDQTNWTLAACPAAGADGAFYRDSVLIFWKSSTKLWYGCAHAQTGATGADRLLEPTLGASINQYHPVVLTVGDTVVYLWDDRRASNIDCYLAISGNGPRQITTAFVVNDTSGTASIGTQQGPHAVMQGNKIHIVYDNTLQGKVMYRVATISGAVAVEELPEKAAPAIFPVPAHESFTVANVEGKCTVEIFAVNGACVSTSSGVVAGQSIAIGALANGTYSVVITTEHGEKTSLPLIKQ